MALSHEFYDYADKLKKIGDAMENLQTEFTNVVIRQRIMDIEHDLNPDCDCLVCAKVEEIRSSHVSG